MKSKYDIRTINFGEESSPARWLVKDYIKKKGNKALSKLIRNLVVTYFGDKINYLILERQKLSKDIGDLLEKRRSIDDKLRAKGINPEIDL